MTFPPHRSPGQDWLDVLVAIPEPRVTQLVKLRLNLGDFQGSRMPAYIMILPSTPFPIRERPEVIHHLYEVAEHHSPFCVILEGSDSFRPPFQIALLSLSKSAAECVNLVDEVRTESLDIEQRFPYHPHVTLAQDVDNPVLDLALNLGVNFKTSWLVPDFRFDRVGENGTYPTVALFDLEASSI